MPLKEQEGFLAALEGPHGDLTPAITNGQGLVSRCSPSTASPAASRRLPAPATGKPIDEPAVLGVALNEVFVPILQKQFPESSIYLPPEDAATAWRVSIKKHTRPRRRVMMG